MDSFVVFIALWNKIQNHDTPIIHFRIASWLQRCWERGNRQLILQAFRASGKSTLAGLFSAWVLYRDPDLRILVLSAESMLAGKMVRTIRKVIETHPLTKNLKPKNPELWGASSITVNRKRVSRDPSVAARGIYANTTGSRADVIICDDVEVPNTCDTAEKRERLRERLAENDFILVPGGLQLYIGTPHSYYSIYADKPRAEAGEDDVFLKGFERFSLPLLNERGECVWPERYSASDIDRIRRNAGPAKFASQMMLQPVNIADGRLDPRLLNRYAGELDVREAQGLLQLSIEGNDIVSATAWWDPSFGKPDGDGSVLAIIYTDADGRYYLHHLEYIRVDEKCDDAATAQCRRVAELAKRYFLPNITLETNGLGKFLPAILRREMAAGKVPAAVVEHTTSRPKDIRILEAFDAVMAARMLHVHERVYKTPFIREMQEWRPGIAGNKDDGLDAVAGALSQEPVRLKRRYFGQRPVWKSSRAITKASTEFEV